jgi:hypothetical protein
MFGMVGDPLTVQLKLSKKVEMEGFDARAVKYQSASSV